MRAFLIWTSGPAIRELAGEELDRRPGDDQGGVTGRAAALDSTQPRSYLALDAQGGASSRRRT